MTSKYYGIPLTNDGQKAKLLYYVIITILAFQYVKLLLFCYLSFQYKLSTKKPLKIIIIHK